MRKAKDGLKYRCRECRVAEQKKYYEEHKEERLEYARKYQEKHREQTRKYAREYRHRNRDLINKKRRHRRKEARDALLKKLSGDPPKCEKCKFSDVRALQVDHINAGGSEAKKTGWGGYPSLERILKLSTEEARKEYQVLCANCNAIKRVENKEGNEWSNS